MCPSTPLLRPRTRAFVATTALLSFIIGCMTPERATREADETAIALATAAWQEQTGCTNTFDITRPADVLTLRVSLAALKQGVTNAVFPRIDGVAELTPSNGRIRLTLADALRLGARNNRDYQLRHDVQRLHPRRSQRLARDRQGHGRSRRRSGPPV